MNRFKRRLDSANRLQTSGPNGERTTSVRCKKLNGAPEEIRAPDPQIRSLVLYPAELRARFSLRHLGLRPGCFRYKDRKPREERLSYPLRPQLASGGNARRVA